MTTARKALLKKAAWVYPLIVVGAFSPIIVAVGTGWVASLFGIQLNEGNPPQIGGFAGPIIAEILYFLTVSGWFFMLTIPAGVVVFISYTIFLGLSFVRAREPASQTALPPQLPR